MLRKEAYPDLNEFKALAKSANRIPVYREILGDLETPLSAFTKIGVDSDAFLFESVEGGEKWARYSFIGLDPELIVRSKGGTAEIIRGAKLERTSVDKDPLDVLRRLMAQENPVSFPELPRFCGGMVGYVSYDCVRYFERLPTLAADELGCFDVSFMMPRVLLAFDNLHHTIKVIAPVSVTSRSDAERAYGEAISRIGEIIRRLQSPKPLVSEINGHGPIEFVSNFTRDQYMRVVEKCLEYIRAGDIIQVVPSQRFRGAARIDSLNLYRALRYVNPSPYLFFLRLGPDVLVGSSPEVMVRLEDGVATLRPIAGTRPRGKDRAEDVRLESELVADPKEKAEHVMLVDLGRNDLGRVCETGTVKVDEYMVVERYSHVMHLVSSVTGRLEDKKHDSFDLVRATFPAGTLTGAPKIRAMEIIEEVEPARRGVYGGCVGYFGFDGNMDMCITIRTALIKDGIVNIQAGGGVVADSNPETEYQETVNKAKGVLRAVEMAGGGML